MFHIERKKKKDIKEKIFIGLGDPEFIWLSHKNKH